MKLHALRISLLTTLKGLDRHHRTKCLFKQLYNYLAFYLCFSNIAKNILWNSELFTLRSVLQTKCNLKSQSV